METTIYSVLTALAGNPANDLQALVLYIVSVVLTVYLILMLFYILFILARLTR